MLEEADISIENAYKEGYKQAVIEFEPELKYYKEKEKKDARKNINTFLKASLISFIAGLVAGIVIN